jgi:hypothetical protein
MRSNQNQMTGYLKYYQGSQIVNTKLSRCMR